jgi:hypothetical protein
MIRTTVIPNTSNFKVSLDFPKDYLGEEVEIIAFKKEEGILERKPRPKGFVSFETIKIDTSDFKFDREEANER